MAETVDLIRDYSKEFILRPINEKFEKIEFFFNEKMEKMEKHFVQRIQQLENLIENNNQKTGELNKVIDNLQVNQIKFEGKNEYIHETNEKKFQQFELRLNNMIHSKENKAKAKGQLQVEQSFKFEQTCNTLNKEAEKFKKIENDTKKAIAELQSKAETASKAIEEIKSKEIGQLKQINFNKELDKVKN
ncbi:hypothetical protein CHUAL_000102 [Chamberlinius hualienensis]